MENPIVAVLARKVDEDTVLIEEMLQMVPAGKEEWRPDWLSSTGEPAFSVTRLAAHLVESYGGLTACFARLHGEKLAQFEALKDQIAEAKSPSLAESRALIASCRIHAAEGFAATSDADLSSLIVTYFSPKGEPFLETLLSNWKHIHHHAHQLFLYLKLLGVPVSTQHLYRFKTKE